jgi:hypothetical protein
MDATVGLAATLKHDAQTAVDLLTGLANRSLVAVIPGITPPRYRLLETVRDYALERLVASGEQAHARAAHLEIVELMCRTAQADMLRGRMRETIPGLAREHGNISVALDTALSAVEGHRAALSIIGSLVLYSKASGEYQTLARWCRNVLGSTGHGASIERARALLTWGVIQVHFCAADEWAETVLPEAARMAAEQGDWWTEAYARGYLALGQANWGRPNEAEESATVIETRIREHHGDAVLVGLAGLARGWISLARGQPADALAALGAVRGLGLDLHQDHFLEMYIAFSQFELGDVVAAARQWLRAMDLSLTVTNIRGVAGSIEGCGYLACRYGEWVLGARLLAAAEAIRERTGIPLFRFWLRHRDAALDQLHRSLSPAQFAAAMRNGAELRQEDAANEAHANLARFVEARGRTSSQSATNRPPAS